MKGFILHLRKCTSTVPVRQLGSAETLRDPYLQEEMLTVLPTPLSGLVGRGREGVRK